MAIRRLDQQSLSAWVDRIIAQTRVIGVQAKGDKFEFRPLSRAADLRLDHDVAYTPPRVFFQPARETLLRFSGSGYESVIGAEPFVLFGVHPYDVVAIAPDGPLLHPGQPRRALPGAAQRSVTIVACDVQNASENVFAACMGTATVHGRVRRAADAGGRLLRGRLAHRRRARPCWRPGRRCRTPTRSAWPRARAGLAGRRPKLLRRHELQCSPQRSAAPAGAAPTSTRSGRRRRRTCFSCGSCVDGLPDLLLLRRAGRGGLGPGQRHARCARGTAAC